MGISGVQMTRGHYGVERPSFSFPLSEDDRKLVEQFVTQNEECAIYIGGCFISRDRDGPNIWGTDLYGMDTLCTNGCSAEDVEQMLAWVAWQRNPKFRHPAEGNYSGDDDFDDDRGEFQIPETVVCSVNYPMQPEDEQAARTALQSWPLRLLIVGAYGSCSVSLAWGDDYYTVVDWFGKTIIWHGYTGVQEEILSFVNGQLTWPAFDVDWDLIV